MVAIYCLQLNDNFFTIRYYLTLKNSEYRVANLPKKLCLTEILFIYQAQSYQHHSIVFSQNIGGFERLKKFYSKKCY